MKTLVKGQVSVCLCIIMLSVVGLAALLVDISRISTGNALINKAVRNSARSVLAEYNSKLKDNYGVFALSPEKCKEAEQDVKKYLELNLSAPKKTGALELYNFKIEELKVTPVFNLSEDAVFKQQILEYMKYRAPKQLAEGFLERFKILGSFGKISEAYSKKVAIDKISGRMDKQQQKLKKSIDGTGSEGNKYINGFNKDGTWTSSYHQFLELYARCRSLAGDAVRVENEIAGLNTELGKLYTREKGIETGNKNKSVKSGNTEINDIAKNIKELTDKINVLNNKKNEINGTISSLNSSINSLLGTLQKDLTQPYIGMNYDAIENVRHIAEACEKINYAISVLEKYFTDNFEVSNQYISDFVETAARDIKKLKELLPSGEKAQSMLDSFGKNEEILSKLSTEIQTVSNMISGSGQVSLDQVTAGIYRLLQEYDNKIAYNYVKPDKGNKKDDPRNGKVEAVIQFLEEKILKDKNYLTAGFKIENLPSVGKWITDNFDNEDELFINGEYGKSNKGAAGTGFRDDNIDEQTTSNSIGTQEAGVVNDYSSDNFISKADLYNEEGMFQEDTFSSMGSLLSKLSFDTNALRDNIYINEYIMGIFKNAVPKLKNGNETIEDLDIHGDSKKTRNTFYDYEVEYILHGNPSQNANKALTAAQLLLVRFGLDTLHVYTDTKKKELATATAAALAGWWTGGAGIPVISNLIMCGWGMGEALIDVKDLFGGKSVPALKSEGDWKLDIGLVEGGIKTDSKFAFSYHDYLRLFLMVTDEKSKLGRMEDLIQLNIGSKNAGFKMSECKTYIRVEAVISMKYLFATQPFMPARVKTPDGRHRFKVLVYEGY